MFSKKPEIEISYIKNGQEYVCRSLASNDYEADLMLSADMLILQFKPLIPLTLKRMSVSFRYRFPLDARVFLNGYQSWSNCRELTADDVVRGIKPLANAILPVRRICEYFGDYSFHKYGGKGQFHGYTYGYVRERDEVTLVGSLSEDESFTLVEFDLNNGIVTIAAEVEGKEPKDAFNALNVRLYRGNYENVFDRYFAEMRIRKPRISVLNGYTSWYQYFQKINRDIILTDLEGLANVATKADIFQVDDGFQTAVGDWLSVDLEKFPNGMKEIADAVHKRGMLAGLWLAPFFAERKSRIAKEHKEWLLKGENGKPLLGNIGWSGAYILDFYHPEVRAYLTRVFRTVLDDWGYDMVKLDFLYAVCLYPQHGKARGEIMAEAMKFLRELVGEKLILGCGVPLGSAFGRVDLCRISADVDLSYAERFYSKMSNREIISTRCALENAVFRRHLDGRAFGNDPDVFFLRDEKLKFTKDEKLTLAAVNSLLGSVRFVSDNINQYSEEQRAMLSDAFLRKKVKLTHAEMHGTKKIKIKYDEDGECKSMDIELR